MSKKRHSCKGQSKKQLKYGTLLERIFKREISKKRRKIFEKLGE